MIKRDKITIIGVPASPYTRKMLAVLRFKNIDYSVIWGNPNQILDSMGLKVPKPTLLPVMILNKNENDQAVCDSTPIIRELDSIYKQRNIIPENKALAFLNSILEDFGDEWVTKYMFHYRWHFKDDIENAGNILPLLHSVNIDKKSHKDFKKYISELQISRLWVVGSNKKTAPIIERSYKRFLSLLDNHFESLPFLLGDRPSSSDFAFYGQMTQLLGFDPTSRSLALDLSPRSLAWVDIMEDLSGLDIKSKNFVAIEKLPKTLFSIFEEISRGYVPAMIANSKAYNNGEEIWKTNIDDEIWEQKTFPYQVKCLDWIRDEFNNLEEDDKTKVLDFLTETGCEKLLRDKE